MKMPYLTSLLGQPETPSRRTGRAVARSAVLLGIFAISLTVTLAVTSLMINRSGQHSVTILELIQSGAFWPALAFALVLTLTIGSVTVFATTRGRVAEDPPAPASGNTVQETTIDENVEPAVSPTSRQILRLTRNAERLDHVERDLIRAIAHDGGVHPYTQRLLREMRICTSRMLGELSDLDRLKRTAPENPREMKEPARQA
jgi:hypothetical protein